MYLDCLNNLIISVDCFGVSEKTNQRILELVREKKIDRVSVMMGKKIPTSQVKELLRSGVKIDIQFHLLEKDFYRNSGEEKNKKSYRKRIAIFLIDFLTGRYGSAKVKIIWRKQMGEFRSIFGRYPDGINSYENIHFFPPLFKVALKMKREFDVSYIRLGKVRCLEKLNRSTFLLNRMRVASFRRNLLFLKPLGIAKNYPFEFNTSDFLVYFSWIKSIQDFFENILDRTQTEIVFHPEQKKEYDFLMKEF